MIFVTVGSAPYNFKRVLAEIDALAPALSDEVVIQSGYSDYAPCHVRSYSFLPYEKVMEYFKICHLVISHTSAGPLIYARKFNKPLILIPRQKRFNEHIDNHQVDIAKRMENSSKMIEVVYDARELSAAIQRGLLKIDRDSNYEDAPLQTGRLISGIRDFVNNIERP